VVRSRPGRPCRPAGPAARGPDVAQLRSAEHGKAPAEAGACLVSSSEPIQKKTTANDPGTQR
jgi:hypothetical protein